MKTLHWIAFALNFFSAKITFFTCTYARISISQEFFFLAKMLKLFILYLSWLLGKKTSRFSGICHIIKTKKIKTNFRIAGTKIFSEYFSMAFRNTLLQQIAEMPDLSGHWLCNFNVLGDKNESVKQNWLHPNNNTLTNSIKTIHLNTIQDIETLINKVYLLG